MNLSQLALEFDSMYIQPTKNKIDSETGKNFVELLENVGYTINVNDIEYASMQNLYDTVYAVYESRGANVDHNILIQNVETQFEGSFISLLNFLTGEFLTKSNKLTKSDKPIKLTIISDNEMVKILENLCYTKVPLKLSHDKALQQLYFDKNQLLTNIDVNNIVLKEILTYHIDLNYKLGNSGYARSSIDILRVLALRAKGNTKLGEKFKIPFIESNQRRLILRDLNDTANIEDLVAYKGLFKALFQILHVQSKRNSKYQNIQKLANELFNKNNPTTKRTQLHKVLNEKWGCDNFDNNYDLMKNNPSFFIRNFDAIFRNNFKYRLQIMSLINVLEKPNTKLLIQLYQHIINRNTHTQSRVFNLGEKGSKTIDDKPLEPLQKETVDFISDIICKKLSSCYEKLDNVYIDESLKNINIPFGLIDSDSLKTISRGSRIKLENTKYITPFIHWKSDCDVDLSMYFISNSAYRYCSFSNLKIEFAKHSGDVRSAPQGGSEFVKIDIEQCKLSGFRYALMYVNVFSNYTDEKIEEYFAGFMQSNSDKMEFVPKDVKDKFTVPQNSNSIYPVLFDFETMEMVMLNYKSNDPMFSSIRNSYNFSSQTIESLLSKEYMSVYQLLSLHANNIVTDISEADVVFDKDFAYNVNEINSTYL